MTLTEYETACAAMPAWQRGQAAAPIVKVRSLVADGHAFATARDAVVSQRTYAEPLSETGQLAVFAALTGL